MSDNGDNRITVLAKEFTPAAMEYHRHAMGEQGYSLAGPIVQQKFMMLDGPGEPKELFGGELYFAATFVQRSESGS